MAERYHGLSLPNGPTMPKEVKYHECSEPYKSLNMPYGDSMEGADKQISSDISQMHKGKGPHKV